MGTAILHLDAWSLAWHGFWRRSLPLAGTAIACTRKACGGRLRGRPGGVVIQGVALLPGPMSGAGARRCHGSHSPGLAAEGGTPIAFRWDCCCFRASSSPWNSCAPHWPRNALQGAAKSGSGCRHLGFASEQQVTAALARQWSCPVLRSDSCEAPSPAAFPQIPVALLESSVMIPVRLRRDSAARCIWPLARASITASSMPLNR